MSTVPFLDLVTQYHALQPELNDAVLRSLASGAFALGPEVEAFEQEFAAQHGVAHGVALNSGTSALHLALLAAGVGPGDEVITVSMTFIATVAAISYTGATPVLVDVDPVTATMDPSALAAAMTPRTKAVIPVHLYGQSADLAPIRAICDRAGVFLLEDASQAHLARYRDQPVGSVGHCSAFSFYPGKNLGAYGEGGIAITDDAALAQHMRRLRDWGQSAKYYHDEIGFNYRMDGVQGAILRVKLRHLEAWTEQRRAIAAHYNAALDAMGVSRAQEAPDRRHVYHIYSVFSPARDALRAYLTEQQIGSGIHYPIPVHRQKAYEALGMGEGSLPVTERIAREQLSLPMFPELGMERAQQVMAALERWTARR